MSECGYPVTFYWLLVSPEKWRDGPLSQAWSFQLFFSLSSKNRVIVFRKLFVTNFKPDNNLKLLVKIFSPIFSFPHDQQQPLINNTWPGKFYELCLKIFTIRGCSQMTSAFFGVSDTPWCLCQPIISFWHAPWCFKLMTSFVNSNEPKTIIFRIQFISIRVNKICVTYGQSTIHLP